jgi:outer membrane protein TolC
MRLLEIERGLAEALQQRELLVTRLRSTTGLRELSPGQLRYDALASSVEALPRPEQEALQETVLEQNPSLRLLGKQIEASRLQAERAEAGKPLRPKVAAEAELSAFTPKVPFAQDDWADEGNWQARISLVIDTTFFDGGKKRAEAAAARAEARGARLDKLNAIQRIQEGLASGYARLVNIGERIRLQQRHVELAERQLELTQTARDTGGATENDLLADRLARLGSEAKRLQLALSYIDQYFAALSYMPIRAWPEGVIPADLQR